MDGDRAEGGAEGGLPQVREALVFEVMKLNLSRDFEA